MAVDINTLNPSFLSKVKTLLTQVYVGSGHHVQAVPFSATRMPEEQARLWRSSRSTRKIEGKIRALREAGAGYIADVLEAVGPTSPLPGQRGHVTWAVPGQSWHNHAYAVDCYMKVDGVLTWDINEYVLYAEEAQALGLTAGLFWTRADAVHVQHFARGPVANYGGWAAVSSRMAELWGLYRPLQAKLR